MAKEQRPQGPMPKVLRELAPEEIQKAGEEGYDEQTFLYSKGLTDARVREKATKYDKWKNNYGTGYARYLLKLQDQVNKAAEDGDIQILKELGRAKLGIKPEDSNNLPRITIIGADNIRTKPKDKK